MHALRRPRKAEIDEMETAAAKEDADGNNYPDDEVGDIASPTSPRADSDGPSAATEEDIGRPDDVGLIEDAIFHPCEDAEEDDLAPVGDQGDGVGGHGGDARFEPPAGLAPPPPQAPAADAAERAPRAHPLQRAAERGDKSRAMFVLFVPGGKLVYYGGQHDNLVAHCENPLHGRCVKTKTMKAPKRAMQSTRGQGRPVGLLAAWLAKGEDASSKQEHWSAERKPTFAERRAARDLVKAMSSADSEGILAAETCQAEGEGSEPEHVAGF